MITALQHILVKCVDLSSSADVFERLLGRTAVVGEESATVRLDNMSLELTLSEDGSEGLAGLAFAVESADTAFRACERRALKPNPPVAFAETDANGILREGRHVDLDAEAANTRLKASGFDVSELHPGRKPGTRVFTVRNNTLGVPTLFVKPR